MRDYKVVVTDIAGLGKVGFTGPRGSWKGKGGDAEYGIMLHKNGSKVGKKYQGIKIRNIETPGLKGAGLRNKE